MVFRERAREEVVHLMKKIEMAPNATVTTTCEASFVLSMMDLSVVGFKKTKNEPMYFLSISIGSFLIRCYSVASVATSAASSMTRMTFFWSAFIFTSTTPAATAATVIPVTMSVFLRTSGLVLRALTKFFMAISFQEGLTDVIIERVFSASSDAHHPYKQS